MKTKSSLIIPVIVLALVLAGSGVWWWLIQKEVTATLTSQESISLSVATQESLLLATRIIDRETAGTASLFKYFPAAGQEVDTLERLEAVATKVPVTLSILSAQPDPGGVSVNLEARGSFSALYHYLELIEQMDLYLVFEQVNLRQASGDEDGGPIFWILETTIRAPLLKN